MGFKKLKRLFVISFTKENIKKWLPLALILLVATCSFMYGWYFDASKPQSGGNWADQSLYTAVANRLHDGQLPKPTQLHYTIGYSALGAVGAFVTPSDPFMLVSFGLFIASVIFCFFAARKLLGNIWAVFFVIVLFAWDGIARTFNFASELFAVPWNNQVLFFTFAFYLWLFVTKLNKNPSWKIIIISALISGYCFLNREETVLFVVLAMATYLLITKTGWKKWLVSYSIILLCFMPQLVVKFVVNGSILDSGRESSYQQISNQYLQLSLLDRNIKEVVIGGDNYQNPKAGGSPIKSDRPALLQTSPWLWLAPIGIFLMLILKRYPLGLKIFAIISLMLMLFYLSGANMSGQKLKYHCLRYISAGFIVLNLGSIVAAKEGIEYGGRIIKKLTMQKIQRRLSKGMKVL